MTSRRDYQSRSYKRWRIAVFARDGFACRLCGSKDGLNAHHVKTWAKFPALRFVVANGISLCRVHHLQVKDREEEYEGAFTRLVRPPADALLTLIQLRHDKDPEE